MAKEVKSKKDAGREPRPEKTGAKKPGGKALAAPAARGKTPSPPARTISISFVWKAHYTWIALAVILAFSAAVGIACVIQFMDAPFFTLPIIDEESYVNWAKEIAKGDWIGTKVFYQDPLYPYFLAVVFKLFGDSLLIPRLLQVGLGTASVGLVFWTARKLIGDRPALLAAAIMALYHGMYFFEIQLEKATLTLFLSAVSSALGVAAADRPRSLWRWPALGLSLGLLTLLRGNFLAVLPFLLLGAMVYDSKPPWPARLFRTALIALGVALVIVPVTIRNYSVSGEVVLTTSQGGANFYIGNNEAANGRYVTLPFVRANPQWEAGDFEKEAEKRVGRPLRPAEVSRFWFNEAFKWINENPGPALILLIHKARLMIHEFEIPDNHSLYLTRQVFVWALYLPFLGMGMIWGPAVLGMWLLGKKDPRALYPAAFAVLYALSIIPFFIVDRYRPAVFPALAIFSAAFVVWSWEKWKAKDIRSLEIAEVLVAVMLALGLLPTAESRAPMGMEYYLLGNAYLKTNKPDQALPWYNKALAALPNNPDVVKNRAETMRRLGMGNPQTIMVEAEKAGKTPEELIQLGKQLEDLGEIKLAISVYEKAGAKDPKFFPAQARLGYLYATNPDNKNTEKALEHLKLALGIRPGDLDTMNALGNCYFLAGNLVEARRWWEAILQKNPDYAAARNNLTILDQRLNSSP